MSKVLLRFVDSGTEVEGSLQEICEFLRLLMAKPLPTIVSSPQQPSQTCAHYDGLVPLEPIQQSGSWQQDWQEKQKKLGKCKSCNEDRVNASHCEKHRKMANAAAKRRKLKRQKEREYEIPSPSIIG